MSIIFVQLLGGLGNQLFQIAGSMLQQKYNNARLLYLSPDNNHDTDDYRDIFKLEKYDYNLPLLKKTLYQENGFSIWDPSDFTFPILHMYGYFQNYSMIQCILPSFKQKILNDLQEYKDLVNIQYKLSSNSSNTYAFIHVRRGDYIEKSDIHHIQPIEYYIKGVSMILDTKNISTWFIFSDDIIWCKSQEFFYSLNSIFVEEKNPILCLALMSEIHDGAIIGNSTYSWMGAYLGIGLQENSVVYPKIWFQNSTPDLFPSQWKFI